MTEIDSLIENHKVLRKHKNIISTINKSYYFMFVDKLIDELDKRNRMIDKAINIIEVKEIDDELLKGDCTSEKEKQCKYPEELGTCKSCIKEYLEKEINKEELIK